ncbi:MAG: alpha/beta hydrolase family protein [Asticcacaulis sp.]|uniref:alpha/beta hydrolase family protein n=1 Tax=Asticcacaulis sp. TaxID=1872648 RepID=UPI003F7B51D9
MRQFISRRYFLTAASVATGALALPGLVRAQNASAGLPPAPTPDMWAKSPAIEQISLADNGARLAFLRESGGRKTLFDIDLVTNKVQPIDIGTAKVDDITWLDDKHLLISTFATGKEDIFAGGRTTFDIKTVYNLDTIKINTLFSRVEGFKSFVLGGVHRIERAGVASLAAASVPVAGTQAGDGVCLYGFDLDNPDRFSVLDRGTWNTEGWLLSRQGDLIARTSYDQKRRTWWLEYRNGGFWKEILRRDADLDSPGLWGLARDGKSLLISMPPETEGDSQNYYELSPDGQLSAPLLADPLNRSPLFDPYTYVHIGWSYYDGWSHHTYFDPARQAIEDKAKAAADGYRVSVMDRGKDPNQIIMYTEGADDAGTFYYIDFNKGKTITVGELYPQIPAEWIAEKQAITYKAADGLEIEAYLTLPPNREAKNLPLVVFPHGGPQYRDGLGLDSEAETYATLGYAVLQPNFRGSSGYGLKFLQAGYGEWGRKMQTDLSDGVRFLAAQGLVDPKRVCIVGASYGGYAALAGATLDTGVYKCAVDVAGISDVQALLDSERPAGGDVVEPASYRYLKRFLGDVTKLDEISPIKHIDKVSIPVLIVHGKDDTVVEFSQSSRMADAMKAAGKDVTFVQYDHEDHWETNESARTDMMKTITAFILKHNPV